MRQLGDDVVGVAVLERVAVAPRDVADRDAAVPVRGVDGVDRRDGDVVRHVGHDAEDTYLAALVQHVGDAEHGGVVPPLRQVGVDDHPRHVRGLRRARGRDRRPGRHEQRRDDGQCAASRVHDGSSVNWSPASVTVTARTSTTALGFKGP